MAISSPQLQRLTLLHRSFSEVLKTELIRIWQRELTVQEKNTIESYTLCDSFMSLESMSFALSKTDTISKADENYEYMSSTVNHQRDNVIALIRERFKNLSNLPKPQSFQNLLCWEEALLKHCSAE